MKRYRVICFDFDTRANLLNLDVRDDWADDVKALHLRNRQQLVDELGAEFGTWHAEQKAQNFLDLGAKPFSVVAYHNNFFDQARRAFVVGAYYPALTATCALGERVLNQLVLTLRGEFLATPEYQQVYRQRSFTNWKLMIDTLTAWGILRPEADAAFRELAGVRHRAVHFNPATDTNDRPLALESLKLMTGIIQTQFSAFGTMPWSMADVPGEVYIAKAHESAPFVRHVYLPNCEHVGPRHVIQSFGPGGRMEVRDKHTYEERELSDAEFCSLRQKGQGG